MSIANRRLLKLACVVLTGVSGAVGAAEHPWMVSIGLSSRNADRLIQVGADWDAEIDGRHGGPSVAIARELAEGWSLQLLHAEVDGLSAINRCPEDRGCGAVVYEEDYRVNSSELTLVKTFRPAAVLQPSVQIGVQHAAFEAEAVLPDDSETTWVAGLGVTYAVTDRTGLRLDWQTSGADLDTLRLSVGFKF